MTWLAVLLAAAGLLPVQTCRTVHAQTRPRQPPHSTHRRLATVTLLAALATTQTLTTGHQLVFDPRTAAAGVAIIAVLLRAPFLLVVTLAATTAALLRLLG